MAPLVYLLTRLDSDFGTQVLETVESVGAFTASECVEVEHDSATHQLHVLGRAPFEDVRRTRTSGHFEVLLWSRGRGDGATGAHTEEGRGELRSCVNARPDEQPPRNARRATR